MTKLPKIIDYNKLSNTQKMIYHGDLPTDPENQEPLKKMNELLAEFRATLPDKATTDFDKLHNQIIKQFLISYPFKLRKMTPEFIFDLNMVIATISADKKEKIKTQSTKNNLDTINKNAVTNIYDFISKNKKRK